MLLWENGFVLKNLNCLKIYIFFSFSREQPFSLIGKGLFPPPPILPQWESCRDWKKKNDCTKRASHWASSCRALKNWPEQALSQFNRWNHTNTTVPTFLKNYYSRASNPPNIHKMFHFVSSFFHQRRKGFQFFLTTEQHTHCTQPSLASFSWSKNRSNDLHPAVVLKSRTKWIWEHCCTQMCISHCFDFIFSANSLRCEEMFTREFLKFFFWWRGTIYLLHSVSCLKNYCERYKAQNQKKLQPYFLQSKFTRVGTLAKTAKQRKRLHMYTLCSILH